MLYRAFRFILIHIAILTLAQGVRAQTVERKNRESDTSYVRSFYKHYLVVRAYESTKFIDYKFSDNGDKVIYKPNSHNNLGVGFTYQFLSLNIGFYVPFINPDRDKYGTTHYLDLQTHLFLHKFTVDFYGQFYHGYYLSDPITALANYQPGVSKTYLRPDIRTNDISLVVQYVINEKRFSYNAALHQNEYQQKSAGSLIFGGGIYHVNVKGDSALIPSNTKFHDIYNNNKFDATSNNSFGLNMGYAYTFVYKKHLFASASVSGGTGINYAVLSNTVTNHKDDQLGPEFNLVARFALGYNSNLYFAGITYVGLITEDNSVYAGTWQEVNTGNFRVTVAKRFRIKKSMMPKNGLINP